MCVRGCRAEVGTIFALSWLITWYGHVLSDFRHVLRLYDFFLASHPLMAIYFAAVVSLPRFRVRHPYPPLPPPPPRLFPPLHRIICDYVWLLLIL